MEGGPGLIPNAGKEGKGRPLEFSGSPFLLENQHPFSPKRTQSSPTPLCSQWSSLPPGAVVLGTPRVAWGGGTTQYVSSAVSFLRFIFVF